MEARIPPPARLQDESFEYLWHMFSNVNEWIRHADSKAAAILAANGTIAALAFAAYPHLHSVAATPTLLAWLMVGGMSALAISTFYALGCLLPRLSLRKKALPPQHLFFRHIAQGYQTAHSFEDSLLPILEYPAIARSEVIQQIWANSKVADEKHAKIRVATYALVACLVCVVITLFLVLLAYLGVSR